MSIRNLQHLLDPKSVALIGASRREGSVGAIVAGNLRRGGFRGPLYFVNPKGGVIEGQPVPVPQDQRQAFEPFAPLPRRPKPVVSPLDLPDEAGVQPVPDRAELAQTVRVGKRQTERIRCRAERQVMAIRCVRQQVEGQPAQLRRVPPDQRVSYRGIDCLRFLNLIG